MKTISLKITGTSPLLMHSDRLVNRFDELSVKMTAISGKKKKTDEDHEAMARIEWEAGLYFDTTLGPYLPGKVCKAALIRGATVHKLGKKIKTGVVVMTDKSPLTYVGPREIEKMWKNGSFRDVRSVVIMGKRIMRCRPMFPIGWSATFEIVFDPATIDSSELIMSAESAGSLIGIGDYRPEKSGDFGRFTVEVLNG